MICEICITKAFRHDSKKQPSSLMDLYTILLLSLITLVYLDLPGKLLFFVLACSLVVCKGLPWITLAMVSVH